MAKTKDYLLEIRKHRAGEIRLYTDGIVVRLNDYYTDEEYEEIVHEAMLTASLANRVVPVNIQTPE